MNKLAAYLHEAHQSQTEAVQVCINLNIANIIIDSAHHDLTKFTDDEHIQLKHVLLRHGMKAIAYEIHDQTELNKVLIIINWYGIENLIVNEITDKEQLNDATNSANVKIWKRLIDNTITNEELLINNWQAIIDPCNNVQIDDYQAITAIDVKDSDGFQPCPVGHGNKWIDYIPNNCWLCLKPELTGQRGRTRENSLKHGLEALRVIMRDN